MTDQAMIAAWTEFAPRDRPRVSHWDAFKAGWEAAAARSNSTRTQPVPAAKSESRHKSERGKP